MENQKDMEIVVEEIVEETPTLTFEPFKDEEKAPVMIVEEEKKPLEKPVFDESSLTPAEKKMVEEFAAQIELSNSNLILQYGAGAQKKMADFSETTLSHVKTKDLGEIGEALTQVVSELKSFDEEGIVIYAGTFSKILSPGNTRRISRRKKHKRGSLSLMGGPRISQNMQREPRKLFGRDGVVCRNARQIQDRSLQDRI